MPAPPFFTGKQNSRHGPVQPARTQPARDRPGIKRGNPPKRFQAKEMPAGAQTRRAARENGVNKAGAGSGSGGSANRPGAFSKGGSTPKSGIRGR
jgi:hypothetical protein